MTAFDHDAAAARGAERQQAVEEVSREALDWMDSQQMVGDNEALIRFAFAVLGTVLARQESRPIDPALEAILKRKAGEYYDRFAAFAKSGHESDAMALRLAKQLLELGTNQILTDLGMWESG